MHVARIQVALNNYNNVLNQTTTEPRSLSWNKIITNDIEVKYKKVQNKGILYTLYYYMHSLVHRVSCFIAHCMFVLELKFKKIYLK